MFYTQEQQLVDETRQVQEANGTAHLAEDDEDYQDDAYDGADADDMLLDVAVNNKKKQLKIGKQSALDRAALNSGETLNEDDYAMADNKQADSTVFIDNLPKDEASLKEMLQRVNLHIRDLEEQFFLEEDSETEREL